jgi:hypothetical protein
MNQQVKRLGGVIEVAEARAKKAREALDFALGEFDIPNQRYIASNKRVEIAHRERIAGTPYA